MSPTTYPDVNALLDRLLSEMQGVFGEKLTGLYLFGSLTTGDFEPGVSDVDLLAALSSAVTPAEFEALREMHRRIAVESPEWDDRVEVLYFQVFGLRTFRTESTAITVISPGEPLNTKEADWGWLMNWYAVREKGVTLYGPPPRELIAPISRDEFVQTVRRYIHWIAEWLEQTRGRKAQSYTVITMCRALYTHRYGEQVSKRRATAWAQEEMPEWAGLIRSALEWREGRDGSGVGSGSTYDEVVRFARLVVSETQAT